MAFDGVFSAFKAKRTTATDSAEGRRMVLLICPGKGVPGGRESKVSLLTLPVIHEEDQRIGSAVIYFLK